MEKHLGHRAIGVVYNSQYEQYGNYVPTIMPLRYDAFIYLDETGAIHPLHITPDGKQMPETFPFEMQLSYSLSKSAIKVIVKSNE